MTRSLAIVVVTSSFPISGDGSEAAGAFVADLVHAIAREVTVRVVAPGRHACIEYTSHGVAIHRFPAPQHALSRLKPYWPIDAWRIFRVLAAGRRATLQAVDAGDTAHVLALWALPCGAWARYAAQRAGIPYSIWTLGSDIWSLGRIPIVRSYLRRILAGASMCYSDGMQLRDDTARIGERVVHFLPSTREVSSSRKVPLRSKPPYRLAFLGRWHPNKGVDLLLDALQTLNDDDWSAIERVDIYGGGSLQTCVENGVRALRMSGRPIQMHGYLAKIQAEAAIVSADYLLIPSRVESIPVVFSDAMKLGCPVIAMPVGDFPNLFEMEQPSCGLLARSVDALAFATALRAALQTGPLEFEGATRAMAARFDLYESAKQLVANVEAAAAASGFPGKAAVSDVT